jgi:hypothetical protein
VEITKMMDTETEEEEERPITDEELAKQRDILHLLQPRVFTTEPIARFLCNWFRVALPAQIDPYLGRIHAHALMKPVMLGVESVAALRFAGGDSRGERPTIVPFTSCMLDSPQPREKFIFNGQPLEGDLQHACVYQIVCRHVAARQLTGPVAVRLNFYHKGVNKVQKAEKHDEIIQAAGGIKGAFLAVTPSNTNEEGRDLECIPLAENACCNAWLTKTMALVNERNVENNVVHIPYQVCLDAGLPVPAADAAAEGTFAKQFMQKIHDSAMEQGKEPIRSFYAIPFNHVLSWPLRSEAYAEHCGFRVWHFQVNDRLLFYLLPQPDYERLLFSFKRSMLDKVDMRPLADMAMEFVPMMSGPEARTSGTIKLRSYIHYMVPPLKADGTCISQQTIDNLAVTLAPNVPSPENWLQSS